VYVTIADQLRAEGRAKGLEQGRAEGRAEGQAALLIRQLGLRFGPLPESVQAQLMSSGAEELDRLAEQVLSAPTLEKLLNP
jgi:predicted transposase YdaD